MPRSINISSHVFTLVRNCNKFTLLYCQLCFLEDVMKWKHFPRYWPFVLEINWLMVNSPHKGQRRGALILFFICTRTNGWPNKMNRLWFETPSRFLWCHCNATLHATPCFTGPYCYRTPSSAPGVYRTLLSQFGLQNMTYTTRYP